MCHLCRCHCPLRRRHISFQLRIKCAKYPAWCAVAIVVVGSLSSCPPIAIIITIVVISRCTAAHHVARYAVTIIVDFHAHCAVAECEPELGVKKTLWWPFIELTQYVSPVPHCEIGIGKIYFSCCVR